MKKIILILLLITLAGCTQMDKVVIKGEKSTTVNVQLADTFAKRIKGLMNVSHLPENEGMLFIFPFETRKTFWMKNTLISLDLIFINNELEIVDIKENFQPCKTLLCETYTSKAAAKYVLEVNAGFIEKNKIKVGNKVELKLNP